MDQLTEQYANTVEILQERLAALELALEDSSWQRLIGEHDREFSRDGLRQICAMSRLMYLKNPLIQRGVNVQRDYVFGQGISVRGDAAAVDDVVQRFWADQKNQAELTSHQALTGKEVDLAISGNLFFALFTNVVTGQVRVRSIPVDEVLEIICNPEDAKEQWLYKRQWTQQVFDLVSGAMTSASRVAYYPDWRWMPSTRPAMIGGYPVLWDAPVYHVKTGGLLDMRFGVPEVYAAIDWARAYKNFLEDWATIVRAYSRFAFQLTVKGGRSGVQAAKMKMASTMGTDGTETNPAPAAASTFIGSENATLQPVRTSGATTSADDARRLLLMVAATMGLPETFFGDASVGSLATAQSLDRPTELKFMSRQTLWADVLTAICDFVVAAAVRAGTLAGVIEDEDDGTPQVMLAALDPQTGEAIKATVHVSFPPILEHDVAAMTTAITQASALNVLDDRTLAKMMLQALGEQDVDAVLSKLFPDGEMVSRARVVPASSAQAQAPTPALAHLASKMGEGEIGEGDAVEEAARELREALKMFRESLHG